MNYDKMQAEHKEWLAKNYPDQPAGVPAYGLVEEAGELLHAVLKMEQERLWGKDGRYKDLREDLLDAIGDCAIYMCSLCNATGFSFSSLVDSAKSLSEADMTVLQRTVRLVQLASGIAVDHRMLHLRVAYIAELLSICKHFDADFDSCVESTWRIVRDRVRSSASRPKVVCLCGSVRFKSVFEELNRIETMKGNIVLSVGCFDRSIGEDEKVVLDELHKRKIDMADEVLVLNIGGYIGDSTRSEVEYAEKHGKVVRYVES